MITVTKSNLHWNYFIALEKDLETTSRYVEFCEANFGTFSIELAHLLLAAASEVDVLAKCICEKLAPGGTHENIIQYQATITKHIREISTMVVSVPRYGLHFAPWENWAKPENPPDWWRSNNNVKHVRDQHFNQATLRNALNALGALLILNFHDQYLAVRQRTSMVQPWDVTPQLQPTSTLLRLPGTCYSMFGDMNPII